MARCGQAAELVFRTSFSTTRSRKVSRDFWAVCFVLPAPCQKTIIARCLNRPDSNSSEFGRRTGHFSRCPNELVAGLIRSSQRPLLATFQKTGATRHGSFVTSSSSSLVVELAICSRPADESSNQSASLYAAVAVATGGLPPRRPYTSPSTAPKIACSISVITGAIIPI